MSDKGGAFIPYFTGDSFLELKGLHLYGQDLRYYIYCYRFMILGMLYVRIIIKRKNYILFESVFYLYINIVLYINNIIFTIIQ